MDPNDPPPHGSTPRGQVTELLRSLRAGHAGAEEELLRLLYDELHRLAASRLARERASHTLQPTALLDEAWMRLMAEQRSEWHSRTQFMALAALAMRRLLVNHARDRAALKRGGGVEDTPLETSIAAPESDAAMELLDLDAALDQLEARRPELARVVELRFFAGLSIDEVAEATETSPRTVDRRWDMARGWLKSYLRGEA